MTKWTKMLTMLLTMLTMLTKWTKMLTTLTKLLAGCMSWLEVKLPGGLCCRMTLNLITN